MSASAVRVAARFRLADVLPRKGRWYAHFYGMKDGTWEMNPEVLMGADRREWDWEMIASLAARNDWKNFAVEGATESNPGFLRALHEIVKKYPEVADFWITFDGPYKTVRDILGLAVQDEVQWKHIKFLHGTTSAILDRILHEGIRPRGQTNVSPTFGAGVGAHLGAEEAVYLTTQQGMASFAAMDAANAHGGSPMILDVVGIDGRAAGPDEDSGAQTAADSLAKIGSIAYYGVVHPQMIKGAAQRDLSGAWSRVPLHAKVAGSQRFLYFAYGANLNAADLTSRAPSAKDRGRALLTNHELRFEANPPGGQHKGGVATVVSTPGADVPGRLWELDARDLPSLDESEGVPRDYHREMVPVETSTGDVVPAVTYVHVSARLERPSPEYLAEIMGGYRALGFDPALLRKLHGGADSAPR